MSTSDATLLGLSRTGFELPEFAARGIQMTMAPIEAAAVIERDVNGNLINLSDGISAFQKYKFTLSCTDQESPDFAGIWPGDTFTLTCLPDLGSAAAASFTVMLMPPGWQVSRDEWEAVTGWSMELEQV